jgi:hypothetical protein
MPAVRGDPRRNVDTRIVLRRTATRSSKALNGCYAAARRCRIRAALRAAALRACGPFVRTALRAAAFRAVAPRRRAALRACRANAFRVAAPRASRLSAALIARERVAAGRLRPRRPARAAYSALFFVRAFALAGGGGSFTPARRALERPMAMACFVERAPCLPLRTCRISSCTNSPACVVGALPARFVFRALSTVFCSGITSITSSPGLRHFRVPRAAVRKPCAARADGFLDSFSLTMQV